MTLTSRILSSAAGIFLLAAGLPAYSQDAPAASKVDPDALEEWQKLRFGMFIHWGVASLIGKEVGWSRGHLEVTDEIYDNLYTTFNPEKFNADEWVAAAKDAGMKYIVLVTKHHDGFCLWDTKQIDYNIMATPFKRDVVKEVAEACKRQGIAFGVYYSVCDWWHKDFPFTTRGGNVKREVSDLDAYVKYMKAQVGELMTNYGPILTLWFDRPQAVSKAQGQEVIDLARSIQPKVLVNNRINAPGDYVTPEQKIGKFDRNNPWEACMTVSKNNHWGWHKNDGVKPLGELIQMLVQSAGGDGNLLLNIGPRADGTIDDQQAESLKGIGDWMKVNGEAIYATRGGPYKPGTWGASTCKDNDIFLFINSFDSNGTFTLPALDRNILSAKLLSGGKVDVKQDANSLIVTVPPADQPEHVTVIRLETDGAPALEIEPIDVPAPPQA
jgi:alpha-L-fucosidase